MKYKIHCTNIIYNGIMLSFNEFTINNRALFQPIIYLNNIKQKKLYSNK